MLYQQNFSDHLIKEWTGHHSLEALHKYKHTGSDQQMQVSMALLPSIAKMSDFAKVEKKNIPQLCMDKEKDAFCGSDDDDFVPMRKKKFDPEENIKAMFPKSTLTNGRLAWWRHVQGLW